MISLRSMTLILAYIHQKICPVLPKRVTGATHLNQLASWIDAPHPSLKTMRQHPTLAAQFSLLVAQGLLHEQQGVWACHPELFCWLEQSAAEQLASFIRGGKTDSWATCVDALGLEEVVGEPLRQYVLQRLLEQLDQADIPIIPTWLKCEAEQWSMPLNSTLTPRMVFYLVQIGRWAATGPLALDGVSIGQAAGRGYSRLFMGALLEEAIGKRLTDAQVEQLDEWYQRWGMYRLQPVYLLQTKRPEQLNRILERRSWQTHMFEQLSPRSVVVSKKLAEPLARWLAQQGAVLDKTAVMEKIQQEGGDAGAAWLGLRLLQGIGRLVDVPFRPSASALESLAVQLTAHEQGTLTQYADQIMADVQRLIGGRDTFFPAEQPADEQVLATINSAFAQEKGLEICYQGVGDVVPRTRRIVPLRLEQKEALYYLHAYCFLAEANRVFRVDRMCEVRLIEDEWLGFRF